MKNVHYMCNGTDGKSVDTFVFNLQENGLAYIFRHLKTHNETHIYYDRINHGRFSNSLAFRFGFLRQVVVKNSENPNDFLFYIDYKSDMNSETKRFAVDTFLNPDQIRNIVGYRNYIVPVIQLDCKIEDYELRSENETLSLQLSIQNADIKNAEKLVGESVKFISLKDKTASCFGYKVAKEHEKDIELAFENFQKCMTEHVQVFSKYRAVMEMVYEAEIEKESAPF